MLLNEIVKEVGMTKRAIKYYEEKGYDTPDDFSKQLDLMDQDVGQIIRLRFFEEMSLKEIADIMNLNLNTVKAKLYRGLKSLKIVLQNEEAL